MVFVMVAGLPGAGKTTFVEFLTEYAHDQGVCTYHKTLDDIRAQEFPEEVAKEIAEKADADFTPKQLEHCYNIALRTFLDKARSEPNTLAVTDGAFRYRSQRQLFTDAFREEGLAHVLVMLECDEGANKRQVLQRFEQTGQGGGIESWLAVRDAYEAVSPKEEAVYVPNTSLGDLREQAAQFAHTYLDFP